VLLLTDRSNAMTNDDLFPGFATHDVAVDDGIRIHLRARTSAT
jgi:hypothetical protein